MSIDKDLLDRLMEGRAPGDLFGREGILSELTTALAERALTTEMEELLGEVRAEEVPEGRNQPPNCRNGSSRKTVTTDSGKVVLDIPVTAAAPLTRCGSPNISAVFRSSTARS